MRACSSPIARLKTLLLAMEVRVGVSQVIEAVDIASQMIDEFVDGGGHSADLAIFFAFEADAIVALVRIERIFFYCLRK